MLLLAFLFPLAVYCLILAFVNRGPHPLLVPGTVDFASVLFAASGFLLGGPFILNGLYGERRLAWLLGHAQLLPGAGDESWYFWVGLWILYAVVVLGGSALLLRQRQNMTSIYNIEPAAFDEVLAQVFDNLHWKWARAGQRVQIDAGDNLAGQPATVLHVDPFPMMRHVSLYWNNSTSVARQEVEAELAKVLAEVHTSYNPAGTWFLGTSICLFLVTFFGMGLFLIGIAMRVLTR